MGGHEVLVRFHAGGNDSEQVVVGAAHRVALQHFGTVVHELIELPDGFRVVIFQRHECVGEDAAVRPPARPAVSRNR